MAMRYFGSEILKDCDFGDKRLTKRAVLVGESLSLKYGEPLSTVFNSASDLKRTYEFLSNPKVSFCELIKPHCQETADSIPIPVVLAIGDTSYLDYKQILLKRDGYGPIGNGGNGLILHSTLAVDPDCGQPLGLLWEKLWNREHQAKTPSDETEAQKEKRLAEARELQKQLQKRPFEIKFRFAAKESYRWAEAFSEVQKLFNNPAAQKEQKTRIIHVFDREGDIAEVFAQVSQTDNTGLVVRAAHNRSLNDSEAHLWEYFDSFDIQLLKEVELPQTKKRKARRATLGIRWGRVRLNAPVRLKDKDYLEVYAVYAQEINPPEGEEAVEWMLLTTEPVTSGEEALLVVRWYTYRWRIEEYHKILKSGCKAENYRLEGKSMAVLLGFLTVIAVQLLKITYLNRNEPEAAAETVLTPLQIEVLEAIDKGKKRPQKRTIAWAIESVARLGGYLEHRRKTPIGIQVLWRGWLELESLCQGWQLHQDSLN